MTERMLVHNAVMREVDGFLPNRLPNYGDDVLLTKVRCTPVLGTVMDSNGKALDYSMSLVYDCKKSSPQGVAFKNGSQVEFNGVTYVIVRVSPHTAGSGEIHHYEVSLQ